MNVSTLALSLLSGAALQASFAPTTSISDEVTGLLAQIKPLLQSSDYIPFAAHIKGLLERRESLSNSCQLLVRNIADVEMALEQAKKESTDMSQLIELAAQTTRDVMQKLAEPSQDGPSLQELQEAYQQAQQRHQALLTECETLRTRLTQERDLLELIQAHVVHIIQLSSTRNSHD